MSKMASSQETNEIPKFGKGLSKSAVWKDAKDENEESLEFGTKKQVQFKKSRRLYYQSHTDRADSASFLAKSIKSVRERSQSSSKSSGKGLFSSDQLEQLDLVYDNDESKELDEYYDFDSTGQAEAEEFLAKEMHIDLLQQDLAAAEELFFQQYALPSTSETSAMQTQFKIKFFSLLRYNNVEHKWHQKPFWIERMLVFFGNIQEERMEKVVLNTRQKIVVDAPTCWDEEGLVLANVGRLFGCKLYHSIQNADAMPKHENGSSMHSVEYLSGVWLSKVYIGKYDEEFHNWVDDAVKYVFKEYQLEVHPHDGKSHWFVWYPTNIGQEMKEGESVVVFFIQVSKIMTI
uniref:Uncharacterized protein n=1 Tax=Entomoneis paludosa TaxID=265537 RepID=A0A7S3DQ97_9STRA|mmetsp:Transcript_27558/g.57659  ORF Transcript_27558/g.57659 Transcript_27558/m.57659 type:complete len:346 (+) Transcript_27558:96-1133(+)